MLRIAAFCVLEVCLVGTLSALAQEPKPLTLTPEEQKLAEEATKLHQEGARLYQEVEIPKAAEKLRQALEARRKLYSPAKYPSGHPDLAAITSWLGGLLRMQGLPEQALPYLEETVA